MAALVSVAHSADGARRTTLTAVLCTLYPLAYVCSGSSLTVLNQLATAYARLHSSPAGTVTGIVRSIYAVLFGVAPAATIGVYGLEPSAPLALMAGLFAINASCFVLMRAWRCRDPMPPTAVRREVPQTAPLASPSMEINAAAAAAATQSSSAGD